MKIILHNSTKTAEIDDADASLAVHKWYLVTKRKKDYAMARINGHREYLHRVIMQGKIPAGHIVDHFPDSNGLNCRRSNLRCCTQSQNMANSKKHDDAGSSQYKGVHFEKSTGKYVAQLCVQRKRTKLGRFDTAEEAARRYDQEALKEFGEYAKLNFPASAAANVPNLSNLFGI